MRTVDANAGNSSRPRAESDSETGQAVFVDRITLALQALDRDQRLVQHGYDGLGTSGVTPATASGIARRSENQMLTWRKRPH